MSLITQRHVILSAGGSAPTPVLPSHTIRCKFRSGYTPTMGDSQTLVDATENIWDIYKSSNDWNSLFISIDDLLQVIDANTSGVTDMHSMFRSCRSLTSVPMLDTSSVTDMGSMFMSCVYIATVPLFDTSSVTTMAQMFDGCNRLTSIPLFDTGSVTTMWYMFKNCNRLTSVPLFDTGSVTTMSFMFSNCSSLPIVPLLDTGSATDMDYMFEGCKAVESGALALYQQASTQATPPLNYYRCFINCGLNAPSSAPIHAEMEQIPSSWGGLGA